MTLDASAPALKMSLGVSETKGAAEYRGSEERGANPRLMPMKSLNLWTVGGGRGSFFWSRACRFVIDAVVAHSAEVRSEGFCVVCVATTSAAKVPWRFTYP